MGLAWHYPWRLLFAAVAALGLLVLLVQTRRLSWRWKGRCLIWPAVGVILLSLAAAEPMLRVNSRTTQIVVLVDLSAGARTAPWMSPQWLRQFLQWHLRVGTRATVVGFGTGRRVLLKNWPLDKAGAWPAAWPKPSWSHARIAQALAWNRPGLSHNPRWLFTAGLAKWPRINIGQLPFHLALTLVRPRAVDVGVIGLAAKLGNAAMAGRGGVDIVATIRSTGLAQVVLRAYCNGQQMAQQNLHFRRAGLRVVHIHDSRPLQRRIRNYRVQLVNDDLWPQDNQAKILIAPPHPATLLVVAPKPSDWPRSIPGWHLRVIGPAAFPLTLRQLWRYQVVVLSDIPQNALPPSAGTLLTKFVHRTGGGLLIAGSYCAFGPGGYAAPPPPGFAGKPPATLESLSPLSSIPPNRPPVRVIFLIDTSGSMGTHVAGTAGQTRFNVATHAIVDALAVLRRTDHLTFLTFSGQSGELLRGTVAHWRGRIAARLSKILPTGATNPDAALPYLQKHLHPKSILIVLTDGRIPKMNVPVWTRLIQSRTTKFVVVAPLTNASVLTRLAQATRAMRFSTDQFRRWPRMLRTALEKQIAGKAHTTPLPWLAPHRPWHGTTKAWIQVYQKAGTTLLARSIAGNHPLAAMWRRGLGKVAGLAFSQKSVDYGFLVQQMLKIIAPPGGDRRFTISQRRNGKHWILRVHAQDSRGFINGAKLSVRRLSSSAGSQLGAALPQVAPGEYQAVVPLPAHAAVAATIVRRMANRSRFIGRITGPALCGPYFPATALAAACPWQHVRLILVHQTLKNGEAGSEKWRLRLKGAWLNFSTMLLMVAIGILLSSLWAGRWTMRLKR